MNVNVNEKKNIFDRNYCINVSQTKAIIAHDILQARHIFIRVKISFLCSFRAEYNHLLLVVFCVAPIKGLE